MTALVILDPDVLGDHGVVTDPAQSDDLGLRRLAAELIGLGLEPGPCVGGVLAVTGLPADVLRLESAVHDDDLAAGRCRSGVVDAIRDLVHNVVRDEAVEPFDEGSLD